MMVHEGGEDSLTDFFVAAGGADAAGERRSSSRSPSISTEPPRSSTVARPPVGCPGTRRGSSTSGGARVAVAGAARAPGIELGREGVKLTEGGRVLPRDPPPDPDLDPRVRRALYAGEQAAGGGRHLSLSGDGGCAGALRRRGLGALPRGDVARVCDWVRERGGTLGIDDMAAYEPIERRPVKARFRGYDVLTNPPPSSGGILIGYSLGLLERLGGRSGVGELVAATEAANARRADGFHEGLHDEGFVAVPRERPGRSRGANPRGGLGRRARRRGRARARQARLDDPHRRAGRRGELRRRSPARTGPVPGSSSPGTGVHAQQHAGGGGSQSRRAFTGSRRAAG